MKKFSTKLAIFAATSALLVSFAPLSFAGEGVMAPAYNAPKVLSITGEGKATVAPDKAVISVSIESTESNARAARLKNNETLNKLRERMSAFGIDKKDVKLDYSGGYPNYEYREDSTRKLSNYVSTYSVSINVKNLGNIEQIQDAISEYENINLNSTNYMLENNESALDQAREKAFKDASKKAEKLAKTFGVKLGNVSSISESSYSGYGYSTGSGDVEVSLSLYVTYEFNK
jgi:hypothetical protein